ncbi:MAG TPA: tetratricopeptide repeat protein [Gemmatimonadales bacterium]
MAYTSEIEKLERRWLENPKGRNFAPLADAYRKAGELDRAIDLCKSGLERHPDYVSAHIVYGRCLIDMKNDAGASEVFAKVLALDPENIIALKILGEIAERNSRFAEAVNWLTRLLAADPMNGDAAEALARAKSKAGSAKIAEAPTAAMPQPDFVVEHTSVSEAAPVVAAAKPSPDLVEVFDETLNANADAHAAAKAEGLEVQEDVELSSQQVEQVEVEGLARTQYEGGGLFKLDTPPPPEQAPPMPELTEESASPVDLPLIMPDDLPRRSRPSAAVPAPPPPPVPPPAPRPRASIPAAVALSDDDGAADTAALSRAEPVLTETMAELYLKQGHQHDALRVYQALLAQRPGDAGLQRKVDQLSGGGHRRRAAGGGGGGGGGGSGVSAQSFLRGVFAGRGAAAMPAPPPAPPPAPASPSPPSPSAPTTLEAAFETAPETEESLGPAPGHPTHPADDHISLDSVFGEDASRRSAPEGGVADPQDRAGGGEGEGAGEVKETAEGGFSFDQFFGGAGGAPSPAAAAEPRQPARASGRTQRPPENEGELDQFQQWLKKLKS